MTRIKVRWTLGLGAACLILLSLTAISFVSSKVSRSGWHCGARSTRKDALLTIE